MTNIDNQDILLKIKHLQKFFPIKKKSIFQKEQEYVKANKDITIDIALGETLGLVGESGCGKSTFGRTLIQLYDQTGGVTLYYGENIDEMMPKYTKKVFQSIPKVFGQHSDDFQKLKRMTAELNEKQGDDFIEANEQLRLFKIEYENKYGNILRLAGGLLASDDLNKVSQLLMKKYHKGSAYAAIKKQIDVLSIRSKAAAKVNEQKLATLQAKLEEAKKDLNQVIDEIEAYRETLKDRPHFDVYEAYLDNGVDLSALDKEEMRYLRKDLQIIFQDPYSSLDPRLTVGNIIGEGLIAHGIFDNTKSKEYNEYIQMIMEQCGLERKYIHRYPHQFSGGQRQRIGIARALALRPKFIVCDEAVSALDVSIQSQIINLLQDLKDKHNLTYLFITHDLGVVRYISDRIGVMYFGNLVELAPAEDIFTNPIHPYTKELLAAIPRMRKPGEEEVPLYEEKTYTDFDFTFKETGEADKDWVEVSPNHFVACRLLNKDFTGGNKS